MTRDADTGFILINVLVVLGLAATVVYAMLTLADLSIARSQSFSEAGQGLALIRGGEQSAIAALRRDMIEAPDTDNAAEPWAKIGQEPIAIPGGSFALRIEDAQARFNLNTLAPTEPPETATDPTPTEAETGPPASAFTGPGTATTDDAATADATDAAATDSAATDSADPASGKALLQAIAKAADLPDDLADRIAASLATGGRLRRIEELTERVGIDPEDLARLATLATVLPGQGDVNVNAAPAALLGAALDNPVLAGNLVNRRDRVGYLTAKDFESASVILPPGFGFSSNLFRVTTTVRIGNTVQSVTSLLQRQASPTEPVVSVIERRNALATVPPPPPS